LTKKKESPPMPAGEESPPMPAGEDTVPNLTTMPPSDSKEALMIKWVESVDARFLQYHELLAKLATLPQEITDAQHNIELSIAARVAREELKIMVKAATDGIMAGMDAEIARWRVELKANQRLNRILAITAVAISIGAVIISLL